MGDHCPGASYTCCTGLRSINRWIVAKANTTPWGLQGYSELAKVYGGLLRIVDGM